MRNWLYLLLIPLLLNSCASIPVESVQLTDAILKEGKRMHQLNLTLLNKMFDEKRTAIDTFIKNTYTPQYLEIFKKKIPAGVDVNKELPNILNAIIPVINARRDTMQSALEEQRIKLVTKLNQDYEIYNQAGVDLRSLLSSAVKVNKQRRAIYGTVSSLSNNSVNLNKVEASLDTFINNAGDVGAGVNQLNTAINNMINN